MRGTVKQVQNVEPQQDQILLSSLYSHRSTLDTGMLVSINVNLTKELELRHPCFFYYLFIACPITTVILHAYLLGLFTMLLVYNNS
jgi:hypothetical protein